MSTGNKVSKGDIIRFEFDGYIADSEEMFDTTNDETAKRSGIFNEKFNYAPMPLLVGGGRIFAGLDEALEGARVGLRTSRSSSRRRRQLVRGTRS